MDRNLSDNSYCVSARREGWKFETFPRRRVIRVLLTFTKQPAIDTRGVAQLVRYIFHMLPFKWNTIHYIDILYNTYISKQYIMCN